jgi:hypothetical protein
MRRYQQLSLDKREKMARLRQSKPSIAEIVNPAIDALHAYAFNVMIDGVLESQKSALVTINHK